MNYRFKKHYTREEARELLPEVRRWLEQLAALGRILSQADQRIGQLLAGGHDIGGDLVNHWIKTLAARQVVLAEFNKREIQIKDLDRGLVDFPAFVEGKEAFLCWEKDEDDIEYWHDLDAGYAGREKLE
jgi:hypothetical protein